MNGEPTGRERFQRRYPFQFDRFQLDAFDALDAGEHTVVSAPTGSGKTVIAEYALSLALEAGGRAIYTAPVKALSNQKFRDLRSFYGDDVIGLLTGDHSILPNAPVVVMTTEVLRNMLYARRGMDDLHAVVLDEVHFLQDPYRGSVWEEILIGLEAHVQVTCLSATVSNLDELRHWISTVRGPTRAVSSTHRPVPLAQRLLVDDAATGQLRDFATVVDGAPNPTVLRAEGQAANRHNGHRYRTPPIATVLEHLEGHDRLPALYFIFSRQRCSEAAQACVAHGIGLSNDHAAQQSVAMLREAVAGLTSTDLAAVGYDELREQLRHGVAPHHAGMLPVFREVVERCFVAGLVQVVFATETLAVGINMPARSVVIDKMTKFTGEHHETLTPAQFTQLCGRAGRRGLDEHGSAHVLWSRFVPITDVAHIATSNAFRLRSAFRPNYNMCANLVARFDPSQARRFVGLSFAQFQADARAIELQRRIDADVRTLERHVQVAAELGVSTGDPDQHRSPELDDVEHALERLRPGDVINVDAQHYRGAAAVVATASRKAGCKVTLITAAGDLLQRQPDDWTTEPSPSGRIVLPGRFSPHQHRYRAKVAERVAAFAQQSNPQQSETQQRDPQNRTPPRRQLKKRINRLRKRIDARTDELHNRSQSLAGELDRVLGVLEVARAIDRGSWELTELGHTLTQVYHDNDLLLCRCLHDGLLDGLDAAELAALASVFVYEHRGPDDPPEPQFPSAAVRRRFLSIVETSERQRRAEQDRGRAPHRPVDAGFVHVVYRWAQGGGFDDTITAEFSAGDVVRTLRQLVDLLGQVARVSPHDSTSAAARAAIAHIARDVVADSEFRAVAPQRSVETDPAAQHRGATTEDRGR